MCLQSGCGLQSDMGTTILPHSIPHPKILSLSTPCPHTTTSHPNPILLHLSPPAHHLCNIHSCTQTVHCTLYLCASCHRLHMYRITSWIILLQLWWYYHTQCPHSRIITHRNYRYCGKTTFSQVQGNAAGIITVRQTWSSRDLSLGLKTSRDPFLQVLVSVSVLEPQSLGLGLGTCLLYTSPSPRDS